MIINLARARSPEKIADSERIAAEVAAWEAAKGPIQTTPLNPLSHDGRKVVGGKVQMTITHKHKAEEAL
jgi:hypothetical protein